MTASKKQTKKRKTRSTQSKNGEIQQLREREKELNCLYGLTKIIRDKSISVDDALHNIIQLIPPSWQYPENVCVRIKIDGKKVETSNFKESPWKISNPILVNEKIIGTLDVYYLEKKTES